MRFFGLVGHSGAGKITLLRCINGLESYEDESITVNNKKIRFNIKGIKRI